MRQLRSTIFFLTVLTAAVLVTGCGSSGLENVLGGGRDDGYDSTINNVRGTVERVDTLDRRIFVDVEGTGYRSDLRNGGDEEVVLYYDDRTRVEFEGRTYRPEDLERGDRIAADLARSGDRLIAEDIEVLHDVSGGGALGNARDTELRGTVRYVDTRGRSLEIEPSGSTSGWPTNRSGVVVVSYDAETTVEFEGRRYQPENLERGDVVEIELRDLGNQLLAEEILVVGEGATIGR